MYTHDWYSTALHLNSYDFSFTEVERMDPRHQIEAQQLYLFKYLFWRETWRTHSGSYHVTNIRIPQSNMGSLLSRKEHLFDLYIPLYAFSPTS